MLARHPARREAWLIDTQGPSGPTRRGFLRLDRPGVTPSVNIEAEVVAVLGRRGIPVPALYESNPALSAALYQRVEGDDSVAALPAGEAQGLMEDFVGLVGAWHRLDARSLGLSLPWPETADECALSRPDSLSAQTGDPGVEPLRRFGKWWLRRHVPRPLPELVLLQGDTGPGNFIFSGGRVKAVTDWEWARFGDPMEDLGTICCRSLFFGPQVDLAPLFERYQDRSGISLDLDRVRFYRAQQMVQSVIALTALDRAPRPERPGRPQRGLPGPGRLRLLRRHRPRHGDPAGRARAAGALRPRARPVLRPGQPGVAHHRAGGRTGAVGPLPRPTSRMVGPAGRDAGTAESPGPRPVRPWSSTTWPSCSATARSRCPPGSPSWTDASPAWEDGARSGRREIEVLDYLWRRACRAEHLYEPLLRFLPARRFSPIEASERRPAPGR